MKLTNIHNLNPDIVAAVAADRYDAGRPEGVAPEDYFTTTQLVEPTQIKVLKERHGDEVTEDASERIYALLGDSVHLILERANPSLLQRLIRAGKDIAAVMALVPRGEAYLSLALSELRGAVRQLSPILPADETIKERRLYMRVGKYTIGGALDNLIIKDGTLTDWKLTSIFSTRDGAKDEWVKQNNVNALLCEVNGYPIRKAQNTVIYRDWRKAEAMRKPDSYPQKHVEEIETPIWTKEARLQWIEKRIDEIIAARKVDDAFLPECSPEERWQKKDVFKVKKQGNKVAAKGGVFTDPQAAEDFRLAQEMTKGGTFIVELTRGESKRCAAWCQMLPFCHQAKALGVTASEEGEEAADGGA